MRRVETKNKIIDFGFSERNRKEKANVCTQKIRLFRLMSLLPPLLFVYLFILFIELINSRVTNVSVATENRHTIHGYFYFDFCIFNAQTDIEHLFRIKKLEAVHIDVSAVGAINLWLACIQNLEYELNVLKVHKYQVALIGIHNILHYLVLFRSFGRNFHIQSN